MTIKHQQQAPTTFTTDTDGQRLAHVALANSQLRATLYADDYERLMAAGFSRFWQYTEDGRGGAYVTLTAYTSEGHSRMVPVARLIIDAGHGERVRANDGRTLNLRRENLSIYLGRAWFDTRDWYPTVEALREAGIEPVKRVRTGKRTQRTDEAPRGDRTGTPRKPIDHGRKASHAVAPACPAAPAETPHDYMPRMVDRAALSRRVGDQMAQRRQQ